MPKKYSDLEILFFKYLRNGDNCNLKKLIEENPQVENDLKNDARCFKDIFIGKNKELASIKILIEHGFNVNSLEDVKAAQSHLSRAISRDRYDIAELLLENGADPNLSRSIIGALNRNDKDLRFKLVKLLVKHKVNVNQRFELYDSGTYFTALDWTKDPEIITYLKKHGAKNNAELEAEGKSIDKKPSMQQSRSSRTEVIKYFDENFGTVDKQVIKETLPGGYSVDIRIIRPEGNRKHLTLFTCGLSDHPMTVPEGQEDWEHAELYIQLPGD